MARATRQPVKSKGGAPADANGNVDSLRRDAFQAPPPPPPVTAADQASGSRPRRYRGSRGGRRHRRPEAPGAEPELMQEIVQTVEEPVAEEGDGKPKRRRGSRGGRKHHKPAAGPIAETAPPAEASREPAPPPQQRSRSRRAPAIRAEAPEAKAEPRPARARARVEAPTPKAKTAAARKQKAPQRALGAAKPRIPVTGAPTDNVPAPFAHNAEYEFARILDFYGIEWQYEPLQLPPPPGT